MAEKMAAMLEGKKYPEGSVQCTVRGTKCIDGGDQSKQGGALGASNACGRSTNGARTGGGRRTTGAESRDDRREPTPAEIIRAVEARRGSRREASSTGRLGDSAG